MRALAADQNPVNAHGSAPIDSGVRLPHGRYPRRLVSRALTALGELGIDSRQVLDRWMQASVGDGGGDRAVHAFWAAAAGVSGQAGVGIRLAERVPADDFGLLGQLVSNSATLGEALLHGLRLSRLSSGAAQLSVHLDGERTCIAVEGAGARSLHREEVEFVLACGILAARALTGVDISPIEVSFAHDAPQDLTHHQRVFRAPLRFGALQSACTIPTRTLLAPLAHGDSRLRAVLLDEAEKWMERHSVELPQRVRAAILAELRHGDPSIKRVSARVGTYPRMLTRKLGALGLN